MTRVTLDFHDGGHHPSRLLTSTVPCKTTGAGFPHSAERDTGKGGHWPPLRSDSPRSKASALGV